MSYFNYNQKKVYYYEKGVGSPIIIIHGNTASSKMQQGLVKKLQKDLRVISIDLPGHGKSERIDEWPIDFWYENSKVIYALIKHLDLKNVILLGFSGGALIALNTALEHPGLISKIIADSFQGEESIPNFAENIFASREADKKKILAKVFWFYMHGSNWKQVIDNDTKVIFAHNEKIGKFFHKNLSEIEIPTFLTGSKNDEFITNALEIYKKIESKIPKGKVKIYDKGKHPASLTVGDEYIKDIMNFINEDKGELGV